MQNNHNQPHLIKARVWEWEGKGAWHFVTIKKGQGQEIKKDWHWPRKGFGSIPVSVTIGHTSWKTSIFPEKGETYVLPLKKEVRAKEGVSIGKIIELQLQVLS